MHIRGEFEVSEGHPYSAIMAQGNRSSNDAITDIWVRVTPGFTGSDELYGLNMKSTDLSVVHHATTLTATLLHVTVREKQFGRPRDEDGCMILARLAVHNLLTVLNGIENNVWLDI